MASERPIRRLLIANRGEIAVRIARAARELGIVPLGIYSDADAGAFHRSAMDESIRIGPPPATESYLDIAAVVAAARSLQADAVHPGYGFLAENAGFARAVVDAGLIFVGPPAGVIAAMGSKIEAKQLVRASGVPPSPGYDGADATPERLRAEAAKLGVPVLIKASAGGGGRGMRIVDDLDGFDEALAAAQREAKSAFGDDRVLLERYVRRPRHIEIQILADARGAIVHLGERECSIQRRHQKIIEEAPSTAVSPELRAQMGEAAVITARAVGYINAGTVEFILDESGAFYFLEMNTRIQVEHPVTELAYGVDLVRAQIEIASGKQIAWKQKDLVPRGWAIEGRLYAEDPVTMLPSSGTLKQWAAPDGPGIRVDAGVTNGSEISVWYDPMLAKIIAWGESREAAIARFEHALATTRAGGIRDEPLASQAHRARRCIPSRRYDDRISHRTLRRCAGYARARSRDGACRSCVGIARRRVVAHRIGRNSARSRRRRSHRAFAREPRRRRSLAYQRRRRRIRLAHVRRRKRVRARRSSELLRRNLRRRPCRMVRVVAPMPGKIVTVSVREGDDVEERALLLVLEAMKMEHRIEAPLAGTVKEIRVAPGALVAAGEHLATVS